MRAMTAVGVALVLVGAACGSASKPTTEAQIIDPAAIPIGDGVSTGPEAGRVFTCQTSFGGGGATGTGPWLDLTARTWDSTTKLEVQGEVAWPNAAFTVSVQGDRRVITTNDLPVDETTGTFPISPSDPAYQYDRNPNRISARSATISLPAEPTQAAAASCVNMGAIGVLTDGVYLFNALDAMGRDAAAYEVLDHCDGHPERSGAYHHHTVSSCVADGAEGLVGYALDGFGIYVERGLTNADLDECHGRTSAVQWDGKTVEMYHYVATLEYPYTVGCYRGTPVAAPR